MPALRVGFDGRAFQFPAAGVRRYVSELSRSLAARADEVEVIALGADDPSCLPDGVRVEPATWRPRRNDFWQVLALPVLARRARIDVYHAPAYTAPLFGVRPLVLTIHDVSYARRPEYYPYRRDLARRVFYRLSALRADAVITVSDFSRAEIAKAYRVPPDRIRIVHEAAASCFGPVNGRLPAAVPDRPFVLHVGEVHARRDLLTALRAVIRVRESVPSMARLQLVAVGRDHEHAAQALRDQASAAGHPDAAMHVEYMGDGGLLDLYHAAAALIYPSRYEGFGLPLVEALACGTPIVASNTSSIPEVVGTAGLLCPPGDDGAFAEALRSIVTDATRAAAMRRQSLDRAAAFSWTRAARETLAVYRAVML
jgi:glycosyltransferase involved in cell wall biosynthesis